MKNLPIYISLVIAAVLINFGLSTGGQVRDLNDQKSQLESSNLELKKQIDIKKLLPKQDAIGVSTEYGLVLNQIRMLESYSGTNMNVQLEGVADASDISSHFEKSDYKGIRRLKINIVVDKFDNETDMGTVLDDVHQLEKNTDFKVSEITKDNSNLIVKGELYGL
jgi:hypothetical protein